MKQRARKDGIQREIVAAIRAIGVTVHILNQAGLPDLLTAQRGVWLPIEIKQPGEPLTPAQKRFMDLSPCPVVRSVAEALALFCDRA